jgi:two-component system response regulator FixJ
MDGKRRVYLVDDDEAVRRSVSFMLRTSGYLVKTFASGTELIDAAHELLPACILLDVRMPGPDGIEVQRSLARSGIFLPVIVMTGHGDVNVAVQAMKAGAIDFIEKPFEKSVLENALREAFERGECDARRHERFDVATARLNVLTAREIEVLRGLTRGHPNKTIGVELGISPRTVEIHRANVMMKLEVNSLSEALRIAFAARLDDAETVPR